MTILRLPSHRSSLFLPPSSLSEVQVQVWGGGGRDHDFEIPNLTLSLSGGREGQAFGLPERTLFENLLETASPLV